MKNTLKTLLLIASLSLFTSCTNDDETAIPKLRDVFFIEDFESIPTNQLGNDQFISLEGWSNVSLNGGSEKWEGRIFGGQKYTQLSAFGTGETSMNTWLITPSINLDETKNEAFAFLYKAAYYNGNAISVVISQDYDGSGTVSAVNNANWTTLDVSLPDYLTNGYPESFSNSGPIDISSFNGNVHIALRYQGGSSGISTTYQIDDIKLYENN